MIKIFCFMLLDFPDTFFGNCAPHKLPFSQIIEDRVYVYILQGNYNIYLYILICVLFTLFNNKLKLLNKILK